jgi:superfamily II DNA or RNA helicase
MTTVKISHDNIWAVVDAKPEVHQLLHDSLKYRPDGYQHVYRFKSGSWDGYNRLYDVTCSKFRRGLLDRVVRLLENSGHTVHLHDATRRVATHEAECKMRPGVVRAIDFQTMVRDVVAQRNMGLIVSPTGSGKSVCIALALDELKTKAIVLVTDLVLLDQMYLGLQDKLAGDIGIIGDGEFELKDVTVSTIQSLSSLFKGKGEGGAQKKKELLKHIERVGVIISDEAHLYDCDGVAEIMPWFKHTNKFYGFSATPYGWGEVAEKKLNLELEQHFGSVIYDTRKLDFVALGLRVPLVVKAESITPVKKEYLLHTKKTRFGSTPDHGKNYKAALDSELLLNFNYISHVAKTAVELARTGMTVFVHASHSIQFASSICSHINDIEGSPGAALITGAVKRDRRRAIYDSMRAGETKILVSDLGGTGLDIPNLNAIVLASDLKDVRQLVGRVIRKAPGKDYGLVVDFHIGCQYLSKHHATRRSQYHQESALIIDSNDAGAVNNSLCAGVNNG